MASTKVAVVSGSNQGIGLSIVRKLCKEFQGDVFLTARDEAKGKAACELLKKEGLNPKFHVLDIESLETITKLKDFLKSNYGGLDVLVNNAGMAFKKASTEPFPVQAEVTNRVNFTGTRNISNELFPLLRPNARVVNVSSCQGHLKKISGQEPQSLELQKKFSDPNLTQDGLAALVNNFVELTKTNKHVNNGWPNSAYDVSKVAVSALTRINQREIDQLRPNDNILINAVHPGWVQTSMSSGSGQLTPEQGAIAAVWLALLPSSVTEPRGGYVWHDKTIVDWINGPTPSAY